MNLRVAILGVLFVFFSMVQTGWAKEKEVPLSEVPQEVKAAAESLIAGIKLIEAEFVTTKAGEEFYELEGKSDGKIYELKITPAGNVLKAGQVKEISMFDVPQEVINAAKDKIKGIRLSEAEKITTLEGTILYELEGKAGDVMYELLITPEGEVIEGGLDDGSGAEDDE